MENNNVNFQILLQQNKMLYRDNKILSKALLKIESDVQEHEIILNKTLDGLEREVKSFDKVYNDLKDEIHNHKTVITAKNFEIEELKKEIQLLNDCLNIIQSF